MQSAIGFVNGLGGGRREKARVRGGRGGGVSGEVDVLVINSEPASRDEKANARDRQTGRQVVPRASLKSQWGVG